MANPLERRFLAQGPQVDDINQATIPEISEEVRNRQDLFKKIISDRSGVPVEDINDRNLARAGAKAQGEGIPDESPDDSVRDNLIAKAIIGLAPALIGAAIGGNTGGAAGAKAGLAGLDALRSGEDAERQERKEQRSQAVLEKSAEDKAAQKAEELGIKREELLIKNKELELKEKLASQKNAQSLQSAIDKKVKGKALNPTQVLNIQQGSKIPNTLTDVEQTLNEQASSFGPIEGRARSMNPFDTTIQTIDAELRAASQEFGRFMEGGVLRKEDEEKYRKMFPQVVDTIDVAKNKLAIVRRLLVKKQNGDLTALASAGFDVSPFEMFDVPERVLSKKGSADSVMSGQSAVAAPRILSDEELNKSSDKELDQILNSLKAGQ